MNEEELIEDRECEHIGIP